MAKKEKTGAPVQSAQEVVNEIKNVEIISTDDMTTEDYLTLIKPLGEKRVNKAQDLQRSVPLEGTFCKPVLRKAKIDGIDVQYPAFPIINAKKELLGYIAVNSVIAAVSLGTAYKITKETSKYVNMYGLNSERFNKNLVGSEAVVASFLTGKSYKASNPDMIVPKLSFDKKTGNCLHFKATEEEALLQVETKKLLKIEEIF